MAHLPGPPYRLKPDYARSQLRAAAVFLSLAVVLGTAMLGYGAFLLRNLVRELVVWKHGEIAAEAAIEGEVKTSRAVFHEYELRVTYRDAAGLEHRVEHDVMSLLEKADTDADPVVWYDPADPQRVAVSWTAQLKWGPLAFSLAMLTIGAFVWLGGLTTAFGARRNVRSARACAGAGRELEVRVVKLMPLGNKGKMLLTYELPASPHARGGKREAVLDWKPILIGPPAALRAVALVSPDAPKHPIFPREDLHPFEATPEQLAAIAAAVSRDA
jgi:hypothetical protein